MTAVLSGVLISYAQAFWQRWCASTPIRTTDEHQRLYYPEPQFVSSCPRLDSVSTLLPQRVTCEWSRLDSNVFSWNTLVNVSRHLGGYL